MFRSHVKKDHSQTTTSSSDDPLFAGRRLGTWSVEQSQHGRKIRLLDSGPQRLNISQQSMGEDLSPMSAGGLLGARSSLATCCCILVNIQVKCCGPNMKPRYQHYGVAHSLKRAAHATELQRQFSAWSVPRGNSKLRFKYQNRILCHLSTQNPQMHTSIPLRTSISNP